MQCFDLSLLFFLGCPGRADNLVSEWIRIGTILRRLLTRCTGSHRSAPKYLSETWAIKESLQYSF